MGRIPVHEAIGTYGVTPEAPHAIGSIADDQIRGFPIRVHVKHVSAMQRVSMAFRILRTVVLDADDLICHSMFPS